MSIARPWLIRVTGPFALLAVSMFAGVFAGPETTFSGARGGRSSNSPYLAESVSDVPRSCWKSGRATTSRTFTAACSLVVCSTSTRTKERTALIGDSVSETRICTELLVNVATRLSLLDRRGPDP